MPILPGKFHVLYYVQYGQCDDSDSEARSGRAKRPSTSCCRERDLTERDVRNVRRAMTSQ